ncbi:MAG: hypothetical protein ACT6FE_04975 [Methanosarcinaceae archaeon]
MKMSQSINDVHLSLDAELSSLYAPEIRLRGSFSTRISQDMKIEIKGYVGKQKMCIIQATGCTVDRKNQTLKFHDKENPFSFVLAIEEKHNEKDSSLSLQGQDSIFGGLFPFISQIFKLKFSGVDFNLTTSIHIKIPHFLTRYEKDTRFLQHTFDEHKLKSPSYMGGIAEQGEEIQMHLHYKSLDAFRRISMPAIIIVWVFLLDLSVMKLASGAEAWSEAPSAILAFLSINIAAFGSLAAIRVGSTLRSLLNFVRLVGVLWVLILTATIRVNSFPYIQENIGVIIDAGLKASFVWICLVGFFSFIPYALWRDEKKRGKFFGALTILGFVSWLMLIKLSAPLDIAKSFASLINK